jgi:hypothetical protein
MEAILQKSFDEKKSLHEYIGQSFTCSNCNAENRRTNQVAKETKQSSITMRGSSIVKERVVFENKKQLTLL